MIFSELSSDDSFVSARDELESPLTRLPELRQVIKETCRTKAAIATYGTFLLQM